MKTSPPQANCIPPWAVAPASALAPIPGAPQTSRPPGRRSRRPRAAAQGRRSCPGFFLRPRGEGVLPTHPAGHGTPGGNPLSRAVKGHVPGIHAWACSPDPAPPGVVRGKKKPGLGRPLRVADLPQVRDRVAPRLLLPDPLPSTDGPRAARTAWPAPAERYPPRA